MNLIISLFTRKKVDCPRCVGKGGVDWDDIKRLNKELHWIPGKCAYCNGTGKVSSTISSKMRADNTYLTTEISQEERKRLLNGDEGALLRANLHEKKVSDFINQIEYLYIIGNLDSNKIVDFYLLSKSESEISLEIRKELLEYIEKVIKSKK